LAGSGPSALTYPTSPATKQTPNTIASAAAAKPSAPGSTVPPANLMTQNTGDKAMAAGFAAPGATAPGATIPGAKPPVAGTAAGMNGYATGPYNTFGQGGAANSLATAGVPARPATPPNSQLSSATPGAAAGYAAQNPYGSQAAYAPPPPASAGLPSSQAYGGGVANGLYGGRPSVAPAMAAVPSQSGSPGSMGQQTGVGQFGPPASSAPNAYASANPAAMPGANPMSYPVNGGSYNPVGSSGPAMSAPNAFAQSSPTNPGMNSPSMTGGFAAPGSQPSFSTPGGTAAVPAQTAAYSTASPNNAATASYRPGSTSRTTGYNFGQPGNTQPTGVPSTSSTPYTANGMSNPGYSIPPNSGLNR
jgi:hypothetical protein